METSIDKEQEMILKVDKKIREGIDVIYTNIWNVEDSILELFKVAGCVFNKEMFNSLLLDFRTFDVQSGNFETLASQITNPIMTISEALTMDLMMKRLSYTMDNLIQYITKCNSMVEQQIFDVKKANLLEKLQDNYSYDVVDYDDLCEAIKHPFLVIKNSDVMDTDYKQEYYPLHVLGIKSFDDKVSAYKYMLANGISKENLILRW